MTNNEMQMGTKVYFWCKENAETPTLRSGRVAGCAKENTIYKWYFTIESNGYEYYRRAWNCYKSIDEAKDAVPSFVIEGADDD